MAIIYDKWIESSTTDDRRYFSAFGNKIIKFHSDVTDKQVAYALIAGVYKIYPNTDGTFEFNLRELYREKIYELTNNLLDGSYNYSTPQENEFFGKIGYTLGIIIYFTDGTSENNDADKPTIYPLAKVMRYNEPDNYKFTDNEWKSFAGDKLTFFYGYPFDFTYYQGGGKVVTSSDGSEYNVNTPVRFWLGNGLDNRFSQGGYINIFNNDDAQIGQIKVKVKNCEGILLKWLSPAGTFKYWLFTAKKEIKISAKDNGYYFDNFADTSTNQNEFISFGKKETKKTYILNTGIIDEYEREYIADIVRSPRVWLYFGKKGELSTKYLFRLINVRTNSLIIENKGNNKNNISVTIEDYETDMI